MTDEPRGKGRHALEEADTDDAGTGPSSAEGDHAATPTASRPPIRFEEGDKVGRYLVVATVGQGGMGVVLAAYDPTLDRKVALKLLRARAWGAAAREKARKRLLREAQAMAKLSHSNVVTVHEVGTVGERVFVAMEYVEGCTLAEWCAEEPRSWREVLDMFTRAGHGLAAANEAGLVHRDFKPQNVLVGKDGRVRVTDFGLVSTAGALASEAETTGEERLASDTPLSATLTLTGSLLGTPIYMAPEQHKRAKVDARADQFAFCVALYEALYAERPFRGKTYWELAASVCSGRVRQPPRDTHVPAWLGRVLLRGLQRAPDERYPSMHALLEDLANDPSVLRRRRLTRIGIGAAIVVPAAVAAVLLYARSAKENPCRGEEALLADVWDDEARREVRAAFETTARQYAESAFESVARALDTRAQRWVAARREACEATLVRGDQSEQMFDARTACLDQRLAEMRAFTRGLRGGVEPDALNAIVTGAHTLPAIDTCAKVGGKDLAPPAEDEAERARRARLRDRLAEVRATRALGRYREVVKQAEPLREDAEKTSDPGLRADAFFTAARALHSGGKDQEALAGYQRAAREAAAAGRDETVAAAWNFAILILGNRMARYEEALALQPVVEAVLARLKDDRYLRSQLYDILGEVHWKLGHYEEADRLLQRALELERAVDPQHVSSGYTLNTLGLVAYARGRFAEAKSFHEQAIALWDRALGKGHPFSADAMGNLASDLRALGRPEETRPYYERVIEIWEAALGPNAEGAASARTNLGLFLLSRGETDEAIAQLDRALAATEATLGPEHPKLGYPMLGLASAHIEAKRFEQAMPYVQRTMELWKKAYGEEHPVLAWAYSSLGSVRLESGDAAGAVAPFERALAMFKDNPPPPIDLAEVRFGFARALSAANKQGSRSLELARSALETFEGEGEHAADRAARVRKWLEKRGAR